MRMFHVEVFHDFTSASPAGVKRNLWSFYKKSYEKLSTQNKHTFLLTRFQNPLSIWINLISHNGKSGDDVVVKNPLESDADNFRNESYIYDSLCLLP